MTDTKENTVLYKRDGRVAILLLNRPDRLNSLTPGMQERFFDLLDRAMADEEVNVVVVTGNGRGFCAGAEMGDLENLSDGDDNVRAFSRSVLQSQIASAPKPVIAAINGPCAGLGMVLASMTDIRFITKSAKVTTAFSKRGLAAEYGISSILPRIIGWTNAMDLLLTSKIILGDKAKEIGFALEVFDTKEELIEETLKYAKHMADFCSPASLECMKKQLHDDFNKPLLQAEQDSLQLMAATFGHPDFKEGVSSYVEKRDPKFQGLKAGSFHRLLLDDLKSKL